MRTIPLFKPFIPPREELMPALEEVLYSGYIAQGEKVKEFEKKFGAYIGNPNVVAVSSCTAALHLALILAGVGPGDEVISTPMTAEPTNMAILHTGAKIVWADVDPLNGNIDPLSVKEKVSDKTKAIMIVNYGGIPADIDNLNRCAFWGGRKRDIHLIEDCAHSLGAIHNYRMMQSAAHFSCYSFQAIKHMTTVEGGMLAFNLRDNQLEKYKEAVLKRWFGIDRESERTEANVSSIGYKYNYNEVLATMGLIQLNHVEDNVRYHRQNGEWFDHNLVGIEDLETCFYYPDTRPSYWFYTILTNRRDELMKHLRENGIGCGKGHNRNDRHSVFYFRVESNSYLDVSRDSSGLTHFYSRMLHIPCGWWVTPDDREYIAEKIEEALK